MKTSILAKGAFDMAALRKSRVQSKTRVDLADGLRQISPEIEKLKVGETAQIEGVKQEDNRKIVMSITAKLSHLTSKGGEWEGKSYDVASDSEAGVVYVQRNSNLKPDEIKERRKGGGGGRKRKAAVEAVQGATGDAPTGDTVTVVGGDGATVREHA